jgi:hypothetical protein
VAAGLLKCDWRADARGENSADRAIADIDDESLACGRGEQRVNEQRDVGDFEANTQHGCGNHPTHIHTGTCANFDPDPTYPLTTVILEDVSDVGVSETTVEEVRLRDLLRADYVILVHKSPEELTNYFVCGDIKRSASVNQVPQAGVSPGHFTSLWTTLFAALAVLCAIASVGLQFKRGSQA